MRNSSRSNRHGKGGDDGFKLPKMPLHSSSNKFGSARFPSKDDLEKHLSPSSEDKASISFHHWILLLEDESRHEYEALVDQSLTLSSKDLCRNVMTIGQIGSGKTQKIMWPMIASALANKDQSLVILGSKGDEFDVVKKMCAELRPGGRVVCINLSDAQRTTMGWNPFACEGKPDRESEARQNGQILSEVNGVGKHDSPFWRQNATRLMAGIILGLEKKYGVATPVGLYQVLEAPESVRDKFLEDARNQGVPFLGEFLEMSASSNTNLQTILVETQGNCQHLIDRNMALVTSKNEFQFNMLFDEPTVVVLETFQDDVMKTRPFINMFFAQLFDSISRKAKRCAGRKLPRPLSIFLDDFAASVGYIPECAQRLNMLRSMDARIVVALQSLAQLDQYYNPGEAQAIINACGTKIFLPPMSVSDSRYASADSGGTTAGVAPDAEGEEKRSIGFARNDGPTEARYAKDKPDPSEYARPLLLDSDIRYSPKHPEYGFAATVFLPDQYPFQAWAPSAWQMEELRDYMVVEARESDDGEEPEKPFDYLAPWRDSTVDPGGRAESLEAARAKSDAYRTRLLNELRPKTDAALRAGIEANKRLLAYDETSGSAKKWWDSFENENKERLSLVWQLSAELVMRKSTITEFFLTYIYSNTDNIQANLYYLDYSRIKKETDREKRKGFEEAICACDDKEDLDEDEEDERDENFERDECERDDDDFERDDDDFVKF